MTIIHVITPRAECLTCDSKVLLYASGDELLQEEERRHYRGSVRDRAEKTNHDCNGFIVFDDDDKLLGRKVCAHGICRLSEVGSLNQEWLGEK